MNVVVKEGTKDDCPVWWVLSVTKTGTHRLAACEDEETAQELADFFLGKK